MANYQLEQTGAEVQALLNAVESPDTTPAAGSSNLITSGAVQAAVAGVSAEVTALGHEVVKGWILAEAFTVSSVTRADHLVTTANVVWPDTKTGSLTITRNTDGLATQMVATHDGTTYTLAITRNSDGEVTATSIS